MSWPLALFSDLHVDADHADVTLGIADRVAREAAGAGAECLAFLGDWWAQGKLQPTWLVNRARDLVASWGEMFRRVIFLAGNHDQYQIDGRNLLELFVGLPKVTVWTYPGLDEFGLWVPYRRDVVEALACWRCPWPAGRCAQGSRAARSRICRSWAR